MTSETPLAPGPAPTVPSVVQQQLLQAMVEGIKTGVLISDGEVVIYANPELGRLLGYAEDESLVGLALDTLVAEGDQALAAQRRKAVAAGRRIPTGWIKFRAKGGALVQMMPSLSRVFWNGQPHFISAVSRASDQDLLDIQVRKTRARYERLLVAELERQQADMARELHDSLGSELAGVSLMLGGIKAMRPADPQLQVAIEQTLGQLQKAVDATRAMARGLMPVDAHAGGFWRALERLASDWTLLKGVPCEFAMSGDFEHVPPDAGTHVYRIVQEAIANALRHGAASEIALTLSENDGELTVEIADNGAGFDLDIVNAVQHAGLGIRSMMARARTIGGRVEFSSTPASGSCVRVSWPAGHPPRA